MGNEILWKPVLLCESCLDTGGLATEAAFILPQLGGTARIVCEGHAEDWYDSESDNLMSAARALHELSDGQRAHVRAQED